MPLGGIKTLSRHWRRSRQQDAHAAWGPGKKYGARRCCMHNHPSPMDEVIAPPSIALVHKTGPSLHDNNGTPPIPTPHRLRGRVASLARAGGELELDFERGGGEAGEKEINTHAQRVSRSGPGKTEQQQYGGKKKIRGLQLGATPTYALGGGSMCVAGAQPHVCAPPRAPCPWIDDVYCSTKCNLTPSCTAVRCLMSDVRCLQIFGFWQRRATLQYTRDNVKLHSVIMEKS
jgi:hypothetical protein